MKRRIYYKGVRVNMLGLPVFDQKPAKYNLKYNKSKRLYLRTFNIVAEKKLPKNLIVIYDIPEERKKERDWFRRQLKNLDFMMIQKSVWVGPSPLPKDFLLYVKKIGIEKKFMTFKLAKPFLRNNGK